MTYPQIIAFDKPVKQDIKRTAYRLTDKGVKVDDVVDFLVKDRMKESGTSFAAALSDVLRRHEKLARRYREAHIYEVTP